MSQFLDTVLSVTALGTLIKNALEKNSFLVEGEVTGYNLSQGKFVFFDIKDASSRMGCFMMAFKMGVPLEDGAMIRAVVKPSLYLPGGRFSLTIESYELVGEGALKKAYEETKKKLELDGLFDESKKKQIPRFIKKLGIITSAEAAAYTDILRVLNNRWGGLEITLLPVNVQGVVAADSICSAFRWANEYGDFDALILTRGGGSLEELQAFNNELVCRAVYGSRIPVVSAVGHERDVVLTDYVADVRASTPSNAAERVVPERSEVMGEISYMVEKIELSIRRRVELLNRDLVFLVDRLDGVVGSKIARVDEMVRLLSAYNPGDVLKRGFAIVSSEKGVVRSASDIKKGDGLSIKLAEGEMKVERI